MYRPADYDEIIERVEHIRGLLRQIPPANEREQRVRERREQWIKDLITNLRHTRDRAMVQMLEDLETLCLLTKEGGYRLFGYSLDAIREYDLYLNGGRTHIVESYIFNRDYPVQLPLELAPAEAFSQNATLHTLVRSWQSAVPIRALNRPRWHHPGTFYLHVGTEDSLGSSLPPGSMALVDPVADEERIRPNPRSIYLLQFRNGYRCSRCVATRGKLQLLTADHSYFGTEEFLYPGSVRIAGRVRAFAVGLPMQEYRCLRGIWAYDGSAELILPWEHRSRGKLFATKHRRFVRSSEQKRYVQELLQARLHSKVSERTRRRYRSNTSSEPHADALIQMSIEHFATYSDTLRTGGYALHDAGHFSLDAMLRARNFSDLASLRAKALAPMPSEVWDARRKEIGEYAALFALKFPQPSLLEERVVRMGEEKTVTGFQPNLRPGSWVLLEELSGLPDVRSDWNKRGWSRPLYAMRRGLEHMFGYLDRDGSSLALLSGTGGECEKVVFGISELSQLRRVCGVVVPV
ncbi:hypothetical protein [Terriglobus saanensis]|uniref:Uncharacterized protein n=1 Tax=Terriglobus saanensis (strain ATCC BAA-1853 / DSM 23119 / SP1PR4) TaxID=401053 RepID=E8V2L3_TERSS|nr:hypothetical protein [Terriglobus saanensis]ADV82431.1 hypothetical protein AciPR4_1617 [Terriglobus saanensis SP1PR4]